MTSHFVRRASALVLLSALGACSGQLTPVVTRPVAGNVQAAFPHNASMTRVGVDFNDPEGIAVDGGGNVYVADHRNHRIVRVAPPFTGPTHGTITTVARGLDRPSGVAVDSAGNLYVSDTERNRVEMITREGAVSLIGAGFVSPKGVAVDANGDVFVADYGNGRTVEVAPPFAGAQRGVVTFIAAAAADTGRGVVEQV